MANDSSGSMERGAWPTRAPPRRRSSVGGDLTIDLADDICNAFRSQLGAVRAIPWNFAMVAGAERRCPAIPDHGDLATQHHDAHFEAVRVRILGEIGFLAAMNDLKALTAQIAFERFARERSAV